MAKRQSHATFAPPQGEALAEDRAAPAETATAPSRASAKKYHSLHVYLSAEELRTIKLIALDNGQRASDIGATAIREWLRRNGHARSK